jgi:hypothetical protein
VPGSTCPLNDPISRGWIRVDFFLRLGVGGRGQGRRRRLRGAPWSFLFVGRSLAALAVSAGEATTYGGRRMGDPAAPRPASALLLRRERRLWVGGRELQGIESDRSDAMLAGANHCFISIMAGRAEPWNQRSFLSRSLARSLALSLSRWTDVDLSQMGTGEEALELVRDGDSFSSHLLLVYSSNGDGNGA